jgi:hypothetical protein
MINSLILGLITFLIILLSGWLRVLFSLVSISFGQRIPIMYFLTGISYGFISINDNILVWPGFVFCLILTFLLLQKSSKMDQVNGFTSTVTSSSSGFILGGLLGLVFSFIYYLFNLFFN